MAKKRKKQIPDGITVDELPTYEEEQIIVEMAQLRQQEKEIEQIDQMLDRLDKGQ